ncbi:MAG: hypothetical protein CSB46_11635 [Micrococcales bacterium]|nr:MAG: hypothetical protein CSB46_11635 [Micrococcales bacterium]
MIHQLHDQDRLGLVYADETRPLLQGARLTSWELTHDGIDHVVQADGAAASTILRGLVDVAVVGADRIAANGDTANKVGSLAVALACRRAGIPFVVAAPASTVDLATPSGQAITIEDRDEEEILAWGGVRTAPQQARGFNPAFDVTPNDLIAARRFETIGKGVARSVQGAALLQPWGPRRGSRRINRCSWRGADSNRSAPRPQVRCRGGLVSSLLRQTKQRRNGCTGSSPAPTTITRRHRSWLTRRPARPGCARSSVSVPTRQRAYCRWEPNAAGRRHYPVHAREPVLGPRDNTLIATLDRTASGPRRDCAFHMHLLLATLVV